ncbi:HYR domain-containing protein [Ulvibacter litoralis]|uniref:HYR domain-containing protein n=1 Tax=Ulvibacter litoralis TaxID=227084 RepID=UPI0016775604|nr:HYR domain-containing protein [Ulvibacter litoralis]
MKKNYTVLFFLVIALFSFSKMTAQYTENFEAAGNGATTFTNNGYTFTATGNPLFDVEFFNDAGAGDSDYFLDNFDNLGTGQTNTIALTGGASLFTLRSMEIYVSSLASASSPTNDGTMTFTGKAGGTTVFTYTKTTGFLTTIGPVDNGFFLLDLASDPPSDYTTLNIDRIEITLGGAFQYVAIDNFVFDDESLEADPPVVQSISLVGSPTTTAASVDFTVSFNENALNVSTDDFTIDGAGTSGTISNISGSGTTYTVTVSSITGEGTISIDLLAGTNITDALGNGPPLPFTAGQTHTVSRCFQETFESFTAGDFTFSSNGVTYTTGSANLDVENFPGAGAGGSAQFLSNFSDQGTGKVYTISPTGTELFNIESLDIYLSSEVNGTNPTDDGSVVFRGKLAGATLFTITKNSGFPTVFTVNNGFYVFNFGTEGAADYSLTNIDELEIELGGAFQYVGIDNFEHCEEITTSLPPIVQSIKLIGNPIAAASTVDYEVIFNENALNVSTDDFSVNLTGSATGAVSAITGSGNTYTVTVNTISGEGSIRLDLNPGTDIEDADGNTPPDPFTGGETHIVTSCDVETFEALADNTFTWTTDTTPFTTTTANFSVSEYIDAGAGGSDRFLDNLSDQGTGKIYSIAVTDVSTILMGAMEVFISSEVNGTNPTDDGTLTVRGKLDGTTVYTITKSTGFPTIIGTNQGFYTWDFSTEGGVDNSATEVDEIEIELGGAFQYIAVDNYKFCGDATPPTAVCVGTFTVQLDATGNASITAADIDNGSSDDSGTVTLSVSPSTFTCADIVAPVPVTLTVTDPSGNTATCVTNVTVEDNIPAVINCAAPFTVQLDAAGMASITVADIDNGSTDNCGIASSSIDITNFTCADIGVNTVTLTITEVNGNILTCTTDVTVEENVAPIANCAAPFTVQLDATGNASITAADIENGSTDACGIASTSIDITNFTCADVGVNVVTLTVTDVNGNISTCTTNVTVEDNIAPTALCMLPFTVQLDGTGNASITPADLDNGSSSNCGPVTLAIGAYVFNGQTTTASPTDMYFPPDSWYFEETSFTVPVDGNYEISNRGTSSDGDGLVSIIFDAPPIANSGSLTSRPEFVGFTVFSDEGVLLAGDTSYALNAGQTYYIHNIAGRNLATATFSGSIKLIGNANFTCTDVGVKNLNLIVTDSNGNVSTCATDVTIEDSIAPVASCQNITVALDATGNASITASDINNGSTDNCGIASLSVSPSVFTCSELGNNTVTLTVTDTNGVSSTCTSVVTITDPLSACNQAPIAVCQPVIVNADGSCQGNAVASDFDGGSSDPDGDPFTLSISPVGPYPVGVTNVTLTVSDGSLTDTCTTTITVIDNSPPTANCAAPFTVQLDAAGMASITVADIENGSTDNCGIASTSIDITDFTCADIGVNTVTLTVTDVNGNISTCTTDVTVEDNVAPIANCAAPFTIQLDAAGMASITVADIENGSTDNCGIASTSIDITDFTCADVGVNTVTLTVTDVNGNISTCTTDVTVEDNVAPVANCAVPFTVQLDAAGMASITVADIENGSTDACGIASTSIDITNFTCADVGVNTVTLTVTDVNGNMSTCTTDVTVEDNVAPIIACPADVVANTDPAICGTVVIFSDAIAFDNCGVASVVQTAGLPSGSLFPVGVSTIEYTATDVNGNTTTCDFTITVTDNEAPITVCQDITIQLDATGNVTIVAADVDGGSTDNCGIASTTIDMNTFDCSNVGPNNVTLTVTDVNGNVSTCIAVVTVEDVTEPVVACMDITVQLDATGTVTIAGIDVDGGSTDACGIASYDLDIDTFDCSNVGPNTVTLTVTDVNGNTATCTAVVTVEDITSPDLVCLDITLELEADGTATITADDVIASNTDACGIATTAVDITDFDCSDIGTPVTVQVFSQDANGNLATCFATVTVVDMLAPEITCPADQTQDPGTGNLFYEVPDYFATGEATVTDNCTDPVTITTQDPAPGTLLPDGTYTVTLTATDEYGNVGTCTFELIVESELGVDEIELEIASVSLYPNPSSDYVYISNPQAIALEQADIYDIRGRFIESIDLRNMGTEKQIDISTLASATYTVIIKYDQGQTSRRLLKE